MPAPTCGASRARARASPTKLLVAWSPDAVRSCSTNADETALRTALNARSVVRCDCSKRNWRSGCAPAAARRWRYAASRRRCRPSACSKPLARCESPGATQLGRARQRRARRRARRVRPLRRCSPPTISCSSRRSRSRPRRRRQRLGGAHCDGVRRRRWHGVASVSRIGTARVAAHGNSLSRAPAACDRVRCGVRREHRPLEEAA